MRPRRDGNDARAVGGAQCGPQALRQLKVAEVVGGELLRMLLAQRALRDGDTRVGQLAFELGYTSESALSNAFKREVGMSPMRYRAGIRDTLTPAARPAACETAR